LTIINGSSLISKSRVCSAVWDVCVLHF